MPAWPVVKDPYNHQRMRDMEAEVDRLRELLAGVHLIAGRFIHRGHSGFEYEEISEALAVALQELSLIRRRTRPTADAISRNEAT